MEQVQESLGEISAALVAAQAEMPNVGKSGNNTFDRYTYAKLEDYVKVIRPIFAKHGLSMLTSVDAVERLPDRATQKGGTEKCVQVKVSLTIRHKSGQAITTHSFGEGQDRSDKAIYKAITGARKYALASALGLATSDDPESEPPPEPPPAPPKRDLRKEIAAAVKKWSGFQKEDVGDAVSKVAKACGVTDKTTANDLELITMLGFVEKHKGEKFTEVCK